jgi:hypothetical protein
MNDEELDRRLRTADRMSGVRIAEEVLDRVHSDVRAEAARSLRRRAAAVVGLGVLSLGALATAPAAADVVREWLAIAEWQPEAEGEILPDSDMIDLSAPDLPDYIASRFPEWLPIPPGTTREQMIDDVVASWHNVPEAGFTQEIAFRYDFERIAYCGWVDAWLTSDDVATVARATDTIRAAVDWPAFTATDGDGGTAAFLGAYATAADADSKTPTTQRTPWARRCSCCGVDAARCPRRTRRRVNTHSASRGTSSRRPAAAGCVIGRWPIGLRRNSPSRPPTCRPPSIPTSWRPSPNSPSVIESWCCSSPGKDSEWLRPEPSSGSVPTQRGSATRGRGVAFASGSPHP